MSHTTPIACTCPVCGAVRRTEPVLPVLPKQTVITAAPLGHARRDEGDRIYRNGRWISIY